MQSINVSYNDYIITTDKKEMNVHDIHKWLSEESYWNKGVPFDIVQKTFDNSFCIGIIKDGNQIAYARLITDYAIFGYLADVYVLETHRGKGLSKAMLDVLFNIDWVKKMRSIKLMTTDAHNLYQKYGFALLQHPEKMMELSRPTVYDHQNN